MCVCIHVILIKENSEFDKQKRDTGGAGGRNRLNIDAILMCEVLKTIIKVLKSYKWI